MLFLWRAAIFISLYNVVDLLPSEADENAATCDDEWTHYGQHCYKVESKPMSWESASAYCSRNGAKLVDIQSDEENSFLADLMVKKLANNSWIGLHVTHGMEEGSGDDDAEQEYHECFVSEDGLTESCKYIHCHANDCHLFIGGCVQMSYFNFSTLRTHWRGASCSDKSSFICQGEISRIETTTSSEEDNSSDTVSVTVLVLSIVLVFLLCSLLGGLIYYKRMLMRSKRVELTPVLFRSNTPIKEKQGASFKEPAEEQFDNSAPIYSNVEHLEKISFSFPKA